MKTKIKGILVIILLITIAVLPVAETMKVNTDSNGDFSDYTYDLDGILGEYIIKATDGLNTVSFTSTRYDPDAECQTFGDYDYGIVKFQQGQTIPSEWGECTGYTINVEWNGSDSVNWTADPAVCGVISKEGTERYDNPGGTSGTITKHGEQGISHITFCCCNICNIPPVISNPDPSNGATCIPITLSELSITIEDQEGDAIDWTIETSPNIGSSSGTGENNGSKTCSVSGLEYNTVYTWFVNASDPYGSGDITKETYTFTTTSTPLVISDPDPSNGATGVSVTISELSVTIEDPDGYSFNWSIETSPDIGSSSGTDEGKGTKTCSVSGLIFCTTYTWYVNASGYCGNTASEVYTFTTMYNDPPVISNPNPSDDATGIDINLSELSVTIEDPEGDSFNWSIETSPDIGSSSGTNEDNGTKTCGISDLEYNTTYTWYVNASDPSYCGNTSSAVYTFTTEAEPNEPPYLPCGSKPDGPTDLEIGEEGEYCFSATDPNDDQVQYRFDWDDGTISDWTDLVPSGETACMSHVWGLAGIYLVKAQARDEHGATSNWSSPLTVTVTGENDPPYPPTDPIPEHEATDVDVNADLSWTCSDPDGHDLVYDVYFEADDSTPDVLISDDQTENSYDPETMTYETTYYWQIVAKDEYGAFTSGPVWHFTTAENQPPNAPIIDGKTSGKAGTPYTYKFTSTDPNGDQVSYYIRWGDGDITDWTALQASGPPGYTESHTWDIQDEYTITAKAKDENGLEGPEATLTVTMPRNRAIMNTPFLNFLQNHPNLFPILRLLLKLLNQCLFFPSFF